MGAEGRITKGQNYRELCKLTVDIEEIEDSLTLLELWKLTFDIAEREHSQLTHLKKPNRFRSLNWLSELALAEELLAKLESISFSVSRDLYFFFFCYSHSLCLVFN